MKAKELMIVLGIIIVLLIVIIVGVNMNKEDENSNTLNPSTNQNNTTTNTVKEEFVKIEEDGTKVNISKELSKTKKVDGLEITNIRLVENNNVSRILADIKNPTNKALGDFAIDIKLLDKNGNEISLIGGYIDKVEPGKTGQLNASATVDFANAYNFEIVKK